MFMEERKETRFSLFREIESWCRANNCPFTDTTEDTGLDQEDDNYVERAELTYKDYSIELTVGWRIERLFGEVYDRHVSARLRVSIKYVPEDYGLTIDDINAATINSWGWTSRMAWSYDADQNYWVGIDYYLHPDQGLVYSYGPSDTLDYNYMVEMRVREIEETFESLEEAILEIKEEIAENLIEDRHLHEYIDRGW